MINGNDIYISTGTTTTLIIASTKANKIQTGSKLIEISSPNTADWEEFIAGRKSWSFSVTWLVPARTDIQKLLYSGNTYTISIVGRTGSTKTRYLTGKAICEQANIDANRGNLAIGTFSFRGTGPLTAV